MSEPSLLEKAEAELKGEAPTLIATFATPGFKLYLRWLEAMVYHYERQTLRAETPEEWRQSKAQWEATAAQLLMPERLLARVKSLDAGDQPPTPGA